MLRVLATASDYGHLIEALLAKDGRLLSPASIAAMESPRISTHGADTMSYAYGLLTSDYPYRGHALVWHGGDWMGFRSLLVMIPDFGFGVVIMINAIGQRAVVPNIQVASFLRFISETSSPHPDDTVVDLGPIRRDV